MDEDGFRSYMKKQRKPEHTALHYSKLLLKVNDYFIKNQGRELDKATPEDLNQFYDWAIQEFRRPLVNQYLWGLKYYYDFLSDKTMYCASNELIGISSLEKTKLGDFVGVNTEYTTILAKNGIKTAKQLLKMGSSKEDRDKIADENNIPRDFVLELVKLSNLARIPGLKKKRARLFYNAGLETLDKITTYNNPEDLRKYLIEYVEKTGFDGSASTLSEAAHTLLLAEYLKRIVEY